MWIKPHVLGVLTLAFWACQASAEHHKYCIVGAGPAGVQLGFYMQKYKRDYIILEQHHSAAAFFQKYPIHRQLNSINRRCSLFF